MAAVDRELLDALDARRGIVSVVGAGGKKSTLYALAAAHGGRVGVTATVHIPPFPATLDAARVVAPAAELAAAVMESAATARCVAYACESTKPGRHAGVAPELVAQLHSRGAFDVTLVKADGARRRLLKAPGPHEPCLVPGSTGVVAVASVQVVGQRLSERLAHHVDRVEQVTGCRAGEVLTPAHVALALQACVGEVPPGCRVTALINMADDPRWHEVAGEVAGELLARGRIGRAVAASVTCPGAPVRVFEA